MEAEPQQEHEWLSSLIGEWTFESEAIMEPGKPPTKFNGTESVRSIGGLWVVCEGRGEMPEGGPAATIMTLGYDPARKCFVGTFIASMMTHLWLYQGQLDPAGRVLTLDTEGPDFSGEGKLVKYQDIIEVHDHDHRSLSSQMRGPDGKWQRFMTGRYQRVG